MKRRSHRSHKTDQPAASRGMNYGGFAGAAVAALLAVSPVNITVTFSPEQHQVVVAQNDAPNPVCVRQR